MDKLSKSQHAAKNLPESGGGGCHTALLGASNHGVHAGLSDEEIFKSLRNNTHGSRTVPDREIWDAIKRARSDYETDGGNKAYKKGSVSKKKGYQRQPAVTVNGDAFIENAMQQAHEKHGAISNETLRQLSPVELNIDVEDEATFLLSALYEPDDVLYIGDTYGKTVASVAEWIANPNLTDHPHIIPNPMTGEIGKTKTGKDSYRSDACVKQFRFAVVEFDDRQREEQLAFWLTTTLPVSAIIDSGGKSLHGLVRVEIANREDWEKHIEQMLFSILKQLGTDPACKNEARLSRLPGHFRQEKKAFQRLLYLSPEGVQPCQR